MAESACWSPYDCMDCLSDGDLCHPPKPIIWGFDGAVGDSITAVSKVYLMQTFKNPVLVDPVISFTKPDPRKPTLDEQCNQAMASVRALIDDRCAQHRVAIRANHEWDMLRMNDRFVQWQRDVMTDRVHYAMMRGVLGFIRGLRIDLGNGISVPAELYRDLRD